MSVLLNVEVTNPEPDLVLSDDGNFVTQRSTGNVFINANVSSRFIDLNNGTVLDRTTGLIWLRDATVLGKHNNFDDAQTEVGKLQDSMHDLTDGSSQGDWRVPTKEELEGVCYENGDFVGPPEPPFSGFEPYVYWSSSSRSVGLIDGTGGGRPGGDGYYYVWPVRSGQ